MTEPSNTVTRDREDVRCREHYEGRQCCLNTSHVTIGYLHLSVGADGHIFEWGDITEPEPERYPVEA